MLFRSSVVMLNLLDFQIWKTAQDLKKSILSPSPDISKKLEAKQNISSPNNQENSSTEVKAVVETFEDKIKKKKNKKKKHRNTIERFDNLRGLSGNKFYFDLNFYNTTLILVCVLILINLPRIRTVIPKVYLD